MPHSTRPSTSWAAAAVSWLCGLFLLVPVSERCARLGIEMGRRVRSITRCAPTAVPWHPLDGIPPAWRIAVLAAALGVPAALLLARPSGSTAAARACAGLAMALFGAAVVAPGPAGLASRASPAASRAFLSGYAVGVNVRAESLADGLPAQPTGRALADLLRARGIRMVRLLAPPDLRRLGPAPWTTLFDALSGIRVLLTLTGDPQALRTGVIANPQAFASREIEQIDEIRREQGGALPGT